MNFWKDILLEISKTHSDKTAIIDNSDEKNLPISYGDFSKYVNKIREIFVANTDSYDRIIIGLPAGIGAVSSFWAAACANRCYVPVFADNALDRLLSIITSIEPELILIPQEKTEFLNHSFQEHGYFKIFDFEYPLNIVVYKRDSSRQGITEDFSETKSLEQTQPKLAVILYTSGSTGIPKGIMHTHESQKSAIQSFIKTFDLNDKDVLFASIPPHFDAATYDIFATLSVGAQLIIPSKNAFLDPKRLCEFMANHDITIIPAVPTTLRLIMTYGRPERFQFDSVRSVQPGGEVLTVEFAKNLQDHFPNAVITNMFGPAEIITCSCFHISKNFLESQPSEIPVGSSFGNGFYKINEDGELAIGGEQLMLGYWKNPQLTEEKIMLENNRRFYLTGDIAEVSKDGFLLFRGRRDRLVKRRGIRIELDDVQKNLEKIPEIAVVGVISQPDPRQGCRIISHMQLKEGILYTSTEVKDLCNKFVPEDMVPDKIVIHRSLPRTSTGKIDLQALTKL